MMRTDYKLGFVGSLVVVVVASWYFARNDELASTIPITADDEILPLASWTVDDAPALADRQREERDGAIPTETVTPGIDESIEESFVTTDANTENEVGEPSIGDVFAAAFSPASASQLGDRSRQASNVLTESHDGRAGSIAATAGAAATEPQPPLPLERERFETHTIKAGDTIAELARLYYGDDRYVGALLRANPLVTDPANIAIGTPITIPDVDDISIPSPASPLWSAHTHVVRKGDTLYTIARRRLKAAARWKEIYELNKAVIGEDPNQLPLGAALALPR